MRQRGAPFSPRRRLSAWRTWLALVFAPALGASNWPLHIIDGSGRGADGVRAADFNGDGRPDLVVGWEQGGEVGVYQHPGYTAVRTPWPRRIIAGTPDVEDAVGVDLDGDGRLEVVSASEGTTRRVQLHRLTQPGGAAKSDVLPAPPLQWMFTVPAQLDDAHGVDLVIGAKGQDGVVGWLQAPANPRDVAGWRYRQLSPAGWVMALLPVDVDGDGDEDVLVTDRRPRQGRGEWAGLRWLEHPGAAQLSVVNGWRNHPIASARGAEAMFCGWGDVDGDGQADVVVPWQGHTTPRRLSWHRRVGVGAALRWEENDVPLPAEFSRMKAASVGDLDGDGRAEIVFSCGEAMGGREGVYAMFREAAGWRWVALFERPGMKLDLVLLRDLDGDGDLDIITTDEGEPATGGHGLGGFWLENPQRGSARGGKG